MHFHELDQSSAARALSAGFSSLCEEVHDVIARRSAVPAAMWYEQNVALFEEKRSQFGEPAWAALAAMIPQESGKRAVAIRFVKESVKGEIAAWKRDFDRSWLRLRRSALEGQGREN
jgi:hypothetical protein